MSSQRFRRTISSIYDAALVPDLWPAALQSVMDEVGAVGAHYGDALAQHQADFAVGLRGRHRALLGYRGPIAIQNAPIGDRNRPAVLPASFK